ncbi:MAG: 3-methyl-2-oxobutanoate dehydrogenase subunit VorB, partial [Candidatus Omnitrophota bacterium]
RGKVFIQAESEVAAINMVFGASAAGARAMTSSSSPGISLKQEGISYLSGARLPAVIVNVMRAGPGLGNIWPAQSDYFQATKGGGHGDYHLIVLAPSTVQECYDFMFNSFDLADYYLTPVMILSDGLLGQMMEPVLVQSSDFRFQISEARVQSKDLRIRNYKLITKTWALTGCSGRKPNLVKSFYMVEGDLEKFNLILQEKYREIIAKEQCFEEVFLEGARVIIIAYGSMARIAKGAVKRLRRAGKKVGMIRLITLWPFPEKAFIGRLKKNTRYLVVEMSCGQMVEDERLAINGKCPVDFLGRSGGGIPSEEDIIKAVTSLEKNSKS